MSRIFLLLFVVLNAALAGESGSTSATENLALTAVDPPARSPGSTDQTAQATARQNAGLELLAQAETKPERIIDAALAFGEALSLYQAMGDTDNVCAMQANLYWCRKKMDAKQIEAWLAAKRKGPAAGTPIASVKPEESLQKLEKIEAAVAKPVKPEESKIYFDRAEAWTKAHPEDHLLTAIRWFEVADRFKDDALGRTAMERSLAAMARYAKKPDAAAADAGLRETLFTRRAATGQVPQPDAQTKAAALAGLKSVYKADYAKTTLEDRHALALRLLALGSGSEVPVSDRWALLNEALRLGSEVYRLDLVLRASDALGRSFSGVDPAELKREACKRLAGRPEAQAVLTLLNDAEHAEANEYLGSHLILVCGDLQLGLPLWTRGKDAQLARLAGQEMVKPVDALQQVEIGDGWYELGRKTKAISGRDLCLERARAWYLKAKPASTGFAADRIRTRLAEIDQILPAPPEDWNELTVKQWEKLKGQVVAASASADPKDSGFALAPGQKVRICPHPTDTWALTIGSIKATPTFRGEDVSWSHRGPVLPKMGELQVTVDDRRVTTGTVVKGPGKIFFQSRVPSSQTRNFIRVSGDIPVKIVPVEEPDKS